MVEVKQPSEVEQEEEEGSEVQQESEALAVCAVGSGLLRLAMLELSPLFKRLLQKRRMNNSFV